MILESGQLEIGTDYNPVCVLGADTDDIHSLNIRIYPFCLSIQIPSPHGVIVSVLESIKHCCALQNAATNNKDNNNKAGLWYQ